MAESNALEVVKGGIDDLKPDNKIEINISKTDREGFKVHVDILTFKIRETIFAVIHVDPNGSLNTEENADEYHKFMCSIAGNDMLQNIKPENTFYIANLNNFNPYIQQSSEKDNTCLEERFPRRTYYGGNINELSRRGIDSFKNVERAAGRIAVQINSKIQKISEETTSAA